MFFPKAISQLEGNAMVLWMQTQYAVDHSWKSDRRRLHRHKLKVTSSEPNKKLVALRGSENGAKHSVMLGIWKV